MVTALSPIIHADLPLEELVLPEFSGTWRQPSSDAHLRIFRQGKMVFFVGEIVAGSNATANIFKTPLPEGWRPNGNYFSPCIPQEPTRCLRLTPLET